MGMSCWWKWNGVVWEEDDVFPHMCPPNQHCSTPDFNGWYEGQLTTTSCVAN